MRTRARRTSGAVVSLVALVRFAPLAPFATLVALAGPARAQETPQLPPPPPPSSPQYVPPSAPAEPPPATSPPTKRERGEREREKEPSRREREKEREKEKEREERERERAEKEARERQAAARARYVAPPPPAPRDEPPPASAFFQLAFRIGAAVPAGSVSSAQGDSMSNAFGVEVPLLLELGIKVHPLIFLGAYGGLQVGSTASYFSSQQACSSQRSCLGSDWTVGLEMQVHLRPAERFNPWVGYGIGYEAASAWATGGGLPAVGDSYTGLQLARIAAGLDVRLSRYFGIGPFVGLDFGIYSQEHIQTATTTTDQSIPSTALHEWITFGARGVLFP